MPAPLVFVVEFATEAADHAIKGLVDNVKAATIDLAQNVLAPISPSNLVSQIAQQGMGIGALGGNLVNGGIGMLANSSFGFLAQQGAQFNAEQGALNQTIGDVRQFAQFGLPVTDDMIRFTYQTNLAQTRAAEQAELRVKQTIGAEVARAEADKAMRNGSRAWDLAIDRLSDTETASFWGRRMSDEGNIAGFFRGLNEFGAAFFSPAANAGR